MKKIFLGMLFVMTVFVLTSCDSLWDHESEKSVEISFAISKEMIDSFLEEAELLQDEKKIVARSGVNTNFRANVSIHNADNDAVIAKRVFDLVNNHVGTMQFDPLYIVGETVYARIELARYGHITKSARSESITVIDGRNSIEFKFGGLDLNITKMVADLNVDVLTVTPHPDGTDLKTAIKNASNGNESLITRIDIKPPADGSKIIPERDLSELFYNYSVLTTITGLQHIETVYVTNMESTFSSSQELSSDELNISNWNTSNVTNMFTMFSGSEALKELDLSRWDTSNVTNMASMFASTLALTNLDVSSWDTSKVTNMSFMFAAAGALTSLDVSNWDTSSVTNMNSMFNYCYFLTSLDLSSWDTSSIVGDDGMFSGLYFDSVTVGNKLTQKVAVQLLPRFGDVGGISYRDPGMWIKDGVEYETILISGENAVAGTYVAKRN